MKLNAFKGHEFCTCSCRYTKSKYELYHKYAATIDHIIKIIN